METVGRKESLSEPMRVGDRYEYFMRKITLELQAERMRVGCAGIHR